MKAAIMSVNENDRIDTMSADPKRDYYHDVGGTVCLPVRSSRKRASAV